MLARVLRMGALYISIDDQKEQIEGYSPSKAEEFHATSAKLADKLFAQKLKSESPKEVILLCGGSASGKTEFYSAYLSHRDCIVFDSTLPTIEGARIKLRAIKKIGKKSVIVAVLPDDLQRSFAAFLGRDRKFNEKHFYRTHAGSRRTLLWIAREHPGVEIRIYESSYKNDKLTYTNIFFEEHARLIAYLEKQQYNESEIAQLASPS